MTREEARVHVEHTHTHTTSHVEVIFFHQLIHPPPINEYVKLAISKMDFTRVLSSQAGYDHRVCWKKPVITKASYDEQRN